MLGFEKFKRQRKSEILKPEHGTLVVQPGSDVVKQMAMINLTEEDLGIIKALRPFVLEKMDEMVNQFYANLQHESSLLQIISDNSSIERLKKTLHQHISEMFEGHIDASYFEKRTRIAKIHVKIGLKAKWYMCAFQDLFLSLLEVIEENITDRQQYIEAVRAVSKILSSSWCLKRSMMKWKKFASKMKRKRWPSKSVSRTHRIAWRKFRKGRMRLFSNWIRGQRKLRHWLMRERRYPHWLKIKRCKEGHSCASKIVT